MTAAAGRPAIFAAGALAVVVWGGTPIVTKLAVAELDPVLVGILRTLLAALAVGPLLLALRLPLPRGGRRMSLLLLSALGGFVVFPLLFTIGIRYTTAAHAGLILATLPMLTGLFGAAVERRMPGRRWWLGVVVAAAGTAVLIGSRLGFAGGAQSVLGDLIVLASCLGAATGYVAGGRLARDYTSWGATFWGIALGGLVLLPLFAADGAATDWAGLSATTWLAVGYLAVLSTVLAYVVWYWALARGGIARVGSFQFAQPVVTVGLAVLLLGEALSLPLVLSGAAILSGIWLAQRA